MALASVVQRRQRQGKRVGPRGVALAAASALFVLLGAPDVRAEFKVRSPNIDYREIEIEHNLSVTFDKRADKNPDVSSPVEVGVGLLPFWKLEVEGDIERHPGENAQWEAAAIENYF